MAMNTNRVKSMILGYFDKPTLQNRSKVFKNKLTQCRTTAFTEKELNKWQNLKPLILRVNELYQKFLPFNYTEQYNLASLTPSFQIYNTSFSTITANYNWRTAIHKDSGDYKNGYSIITVATEGNYTGGCLGYPQYDIGVDVKNGDFLLKDPHQYHCNTEIIPLTKEYTRLSMVYYYRENMQNCISKGISKGIPKGIPENIPKCIDFTDKKYNSNYIIGYLTHYFLNEIKISMNNIDVLENFEILRNVKIKLFLNSLKNFKIISKYGYAITHYEETKNIIELRIPENF